MLFGLKVSRIAKSNDWLQRSMDEHNELTDFMNYKGWTRDWTEAVRRKCKRTEIDALETKTKLRHQI